MLPNIYSQITRGRTLRPRYNNKVIITRPGLALSATQLNERIVNGTAQVREKQKLYEPYYDIDNPNPLRQPNIDLVDVKAHSDYLSQHYEQMQKHYKELVEEAKKREEVNDASAEQSTIAP